MPSVTSHLHAMLRVAVLLLGLMVSSWAAVAPLTLNINLDVQPEERWSPLGQVFDPDYLEKAAAQIIE